MTPPRNRSKRPAALWKQTQDAAAQQGDLAAPKRRRLRPLSLSRTQQRHYYFALKRRWLKGRRCERCGSDNGVGLHHAAGRSGTLLLDARFWKSLCQKCHITGPDAVHRKPELARRLGLLAPRGFRAPKDAETARLRGIIMELNNQKEK